MAEFERIWRVENLDSFYRKMSDAKLRAAYEAIKRNIDQAVLAEGMKKEKELILNVAKERGIDLEADTTSAKIQTTRGYIEFYRDRDTE
jgi:hypothetical protein